MRTAAKMVYDMLVAARTALSLGAPVSAESWAIYRDRIPVTPAQVVAVFATPSPAIDIPLDPSHAYVETVYVSVHIRGTSRDEAEGVAVRIRDFLLSSFVQSTEQDEGGRVVTWQAIRPAGSAFGQADAKELHTAVQNVQVVRSVEGVET